MPNLWLTIGTELNLWHNRSEEPRPTKAVVVDLGFTTLLTSQVISMTFYSEREKSDKFCSEVLVSA